MDEVTRREIIGLAAAAGLSAVGGNRQWGRRQTNRVAAEAAALRDAMERTGDPGRRHQPAQNRLEDV